MFQIMSEDEQDVSLRLDYKQALGLSAYIALLKSYRSL